MKVVDDYLAELTRRLHAVLGEELVAVYAGGSYALGAYEHGRSDIDVTVVVEGPLRDDVKRALVEALRHEALPCPAHRARARGLPARDRRAPDRRARLRAQPQHRRGLSLPRGLRARRDRGLLVRDRPLDRAPARPAAVRPAAADLIAEIPRELLAPQLAESIRWHRGDDTENARLNVARSQHFLDTGHWISKRDVL